MARHQAGAGDTIATKRRGVGEILREETMIDIVFWMDENSCYEVQWPVVPLPGDRVCIGIDSKNYIVERREFINTDVFVVQVILIEIK